MELLRRIDEFRDLERCGKLNELVKRCHEQVEQVREQHGKLHADTATALVWLGHAYQVLGEWPKANVWLEQALGIRRTLFGAPSNQVVCCLNNLAESHLMMRQWMELETIVTEGMQSFDELAESEKLRCSHPAFYRAMIEFHRQDFDSAERILILVLRHQLRRLESVYGRNYNWSDFELAAIFDRMSMVYREQGKLTAAERTIRKAMRIHRQGAHGKVWISYARMWRSLGMIQMRLEQHAQARGSLRRALRLAKRCRKPEHYDVIKTQELLTAAETRD